MNSLPAGVGVASTPFAKLLLGEMPPVLLAGLLYLGSGLGLSILYAIRRGAVNAEAPLTRPDLPWLAGAVLFGGVLGPVLLMVGLHTTPASTASLLLNLEDPDLGGRSAIPPRYHQVEAMGRRIVEGGTRTRRRRHAGDFVVMVRILLLDHSDVPLPAGDVDAALPGIIPEIVGVARDWQ